MQLLCRRVQEAPEGSTPDFQPVWLPRVLIYADPADLSKVGLRYAWLEGFVSMRLIGRLLAGPAEVVEATKP